MLCFNKSDIAIITVKVVDYRYIILDMQFICSKILCLKIVGIYKNACQY